MIKVGAIDMMVFAKFKVAIKIYFFVQFIMVFSLAIWLISSTKAQ